MYQQLSDLYRRFRAGELDDDEKELLIIALHAHIERLEASAGTHPPKAVSLYNVNAGEISISNVTAGRG